MGSDRQKAFIEMMSDVDKDATAKLFLQGTGSGEFFFAVLKQVAQHYGFDLDRGDKVILHPECIPAHLSEVIVPDNYPVLISSSVPDQKMLFINGLGTK